MSEQYRPPSSAFEAVRWAAADGDADPIGTAILNHPELFVAHRDALAASGWKPIETLPSDTPEWTAETPIDSDEGCTVAFNYKTAEPLFLVWWRRLKRFECETTHWAPLPPGPAEQSR